MSIVIEQTPNEMHASYAFSRMAEMIGVRISSASFWVSDALPTDVLLSVGLRFIPQETTLSKGQLDAKTLFECIITDSTETENPDPMVKFECCLRASYQLQEEFTPTEVQTASFHKANVIFNCWPYFREFVQSCAGRMNIPPPTIPFVRVHVSSMVNANSNRTKSIRGIPDRNSPKKQTPKAKSMASGSAIGANRTLAKGRKK